MLPDICIIWIPIGFGQYDNFQCQNVVKFKTLSGFKICSSILGRMIFCNQPKMYMRGTSQAAAEYSLSLKKPPTVNKKNLTPPKLGPKKAMSITAFRIALTLDFKLYGLVDQWLFVSRNGIKMQFLGIVSFKSLTVYCLSSWFVHQQWKTYSNVCVLGWLSHLSWL